MKKLLSILLTMIIAVGIFMIPIKTSAANLNSQAGTVNISTGYLNVRSSASASSTVKTTLNKGDYVTLISKSGSWWYVEYGNGVYGYCHSNYIKTATSSPATVKIQWGSLNVRSGAGTSYAKVDSLLKGEIVLVLSNSNGWSKILYHGTKTGFVSSQYLSTTAQSTYPAIKLNVPDFKQTDSRWANVRIGSSGKTIGQIGCVTTGIAMMESYRTGTTIYPDAMSKKLSYSSSGNVYWPSHYTPVTSSSGYLKGVYEQLRQGKPVLLGAKKSNGTQHWVVVIGYNGGDTLSASNFIINDPATKSRTTLQQFLNAYPNFYKYFYY